MPRRVYVALLIALLFHGLFILTARYRLSYDAYTHMLFADHYARDWFSLWEPRWYAGFTVVSYPPLTHQLIGFFIPLLGFDRAFALISWSVGALYPLGVYAFARIFTGRSAASYAALAAALLLPVYIAAYVFGQLPFITSTLVALFAAASLNQFLRDGGAHGFLISVGLIATAMASHHATMMVHPFLILAVTINRLFSSWSRTSTATILTRLFLFATSAIAAGLLVVWPFWQWGLAQNIQTPIDHLSRHNFFRDPLGLAIFFIPLYGPLVVVIPFLLHKWHPRFLGLRLAFLLLFLLGLGGTTPLPRLLFGAAWEWLTYDRFAFWASLILTPLFGILFVRFRWRWKSRIRTQPWPDSLRKTMIPALTFAVFAASVFVAWLWPIFAPTQPTAVDMQPIVRFLEHDDRSQWRYLTFGFGNQYTHLNLLTEATTIDGSYHTARTLPELRRSGIAEIDTAFWVPRGLRAIIPILERAGEHGVRWGFVNRAEYVPSLKASGWVYLKTLPNGVQAWENPGAIMPAPSSRAQENPFQSFSWGAFPVIAFVSTLVLAAAKVYPISAERVLRSVYVFTVGIIPVSLCFWYFRTVTEFPHDRVYFTYTDILFFVSDSLVILALILWASTKLRPDRLTGSGLRSPIALLLPGLVVLSSFSTFWSRDWRISLYISVHLGLILLLILSLRDWSTSWQTIMLGLCVALGVEIVSGYVGFARQSTVFLEPLDMKWPGILDESIRGASVVQLADGLRVLRAYGTLPHPNILGGLVVLGLLGPGGLYLLGQKPNYPALFLFVLGVILLALTFSRAAWLGWSGFLLVLFWKRKYFEPGRLFLLLSTAALTAVLALYPLRELVWTRLSNAAVPTEQLSSFGREWLTGQALDVLRSHPLTGIGVGSFVLHLSRTAVEGAIIEPVHSIPLLIGAELGILGSLLLFGFFIFSIRQILHAKTPRAILAGAAIAGLGVIGLFDHYLWTLAPGRILLGLALGLWMGQTNHEA